MDSPPQIENLLALDGYLCPYRGEITRRYQNFSKTLKRIDEELGGLDHFTKGYQEYGLNVKSDNSIICREWAPGAESLALVGEFNGWNKESHVYKRQEFGKFELRIPPTETGECAIPHGSHLKIAVTHGGKTEYKLSPWASYVTRPSDSLIYQQTFYNPKPEDRVKLTEPNPKKPESLRVYEGHVGISSWEGKINSYRAFADDVIPRIHKQGYNTIQMMAVMEHVYYASFGYQVTSFFAPASRSGTPDDLRYLVNKAHAHGITILLDVVHSHASKNVEDGLNRWDGTDGAYFHNNARGFHSGWDSRLFDYTQVEVQRFLLSNLRLWVEEYGFDGFRFDEYGFDGFRFDGVTSMIYHSHGLGQGFSGNYDEYFGLSVDDESLLYLSLANHMLHKFYPEILTIAEEVSGMPALCRPVEEGGQGFDYRLAMSLPDMWIKLLKHQRDEDWDLASIVHTLENRRYKEKNVAYAESHDQALVGDKTIAFWLMDKEMYDYMSTVTPMTAIIERGIALHKMIRLLTYGLGGEGWLNFIGNEFGHPEWLDFPRIGNNESFHYARRQFNLVDDEMLRYKFLNNFDRAMNELEAKYGFLSKGPGFVTWKHQDDKVIAFERAGLVFVFNFHNSKSFENYKVGVEHSGIYKMVLNSDSTEFGGHNRLQSDQDHHSFPVGFASRSHHICVYVPTRTVIVLSRS
uniref:1,4-alpha-glucan branching enzyme n=1 Tax=Steinernema glaseri TaxID=37863 RepID=A0A1I7YBD7_9BILA